MIVTSLFGQLKGQTSTDRYGLGMYASTYEFQGDLGAEYFKFRDIQAGGGISLNYYVSSSIDLGLGVYTGSLNYAKDFACVKSRMVSTNIDAKFKFYNGKLIKEDAFIGPYVLLGTGVSDVRSTGVNMGKKKFNMEKIDMNFSYGIGFRFRVSESFSFIVQSRQYKPMVDDFDGNDGSDAYLEHSIGLIFNPTAASDSDYDGVSDSKDLCPNTPKDVVVDENGCPLDSDGDGLADYLDPTPLLKGTTPIPHYDSVTVLVDGSLDTDGDSVPDDIDYCPQEAGPAHFNGCPDTDNDGIVDIYDECPETPEGTVVNYKGCARDYDNDGIPNTEDKCPKTAGVAENEGCPQEDKQVHEKVKQTASNLNFEFAKNVLTEESMQHLDELAEILEANPEMLLLIEGHTDSKGAEELNMQLSQNRADATKAYLVKKGISAHRLVALGFGEAEPIADNTTEAGRAQNRRVEFQLSYDWD